MADDGQTLPNRIGEGLPTTHEVIRNQRYRLPGEAARKHSLNQRDVRSATIQLAPVIRKVRAHSDQ